VKAVPKRVGFKESRAGWEEGHIHRESQETCKGLVVGVIGEGQDKRGNEA
jgi:hypothetical protein